MRGCAFDDLCFKRPNLRSLHPGQLGLPPPKLPSAVHVPLLALHRHGKAGVQVEHIRLTPSRKRRSLCFQLLESTALSSHWFQMSTRTPTTRPSTSLTRTRTATGRTSDNKKETARGAKTEVAETKKENRGEKGSAREGSISGFINSRNCPASALSPRTRRCKVHMQNMLHALLRAWCDYF